MPHRRPLLALALIAITGLAACGGADDGASTTPTTAPTATAAAVVEGSAAATTPSTSADTSAGTTVEASAYPVTIEHKFGATTIDAAPSRVVSLGYTEQDAIVAFGVVPIAVRYAFGPEDDVFFPWADEAAGDADPVILPRAEVNLEQIAELDPDLIMAVTAGLTEEQYDTLSAVAPVVVQPADYADFATPWQVQTQITGEALGQPERAAALIADVEAQVAAARNAHPELEGKSFVLSGPMYEGQYPFHASGDPRVRIFTDLGVTVPAELDELAGGQFYGTVSQEQVAMLDADLLVFQSGSDEERAGIEADPLLSSLSAVTAGHRLFVEGPDYDALQFVSVLSIPFLLEGFVPELAAAAAS